MVTVIQALLRELEVIYPFEVVISGVYDTPTVDAVKAVQQSYGIPVNGIIDPDTWNAIVSEYEKSKSSL